MMHVSSGSVELIRRAKARGVRDDRPKLLPAPLHAHRRMPAVVRFELQDEPAAACAKHVDACIAGLSRRHDRRHLAPIMRRALEKKMRELDQAPFGIVGLETALACVITQLIKPGHLDWPTALAKITINPWDLESEEGHAAAGCRRRRHDHRSASALDREARRVRLEE